MTLTPGAVYNDWFVVSVLQHSGQAPIILREVVPREIERAGHMTLFEEH